MVKIAILYDSKYGNTKLLAEYLEEKIQEGGHEVKLFRTNKTKPKHLFVFEPEAILVGGPTHFGKPARTLSKYIEKLGKFKQISKIRKVAVFNCYTGDIVCKNIKDQINAVLPETDTLEKSLSIHTGDEKGENWNKIMLQENWKEEADAFISEFLKFIS